MRLIIKSLNGKNSLVDCKCDNVVNVASSIMDFVAIKLRENPHAEFLKFSCVLSREIKQDEIAFDFTPGIITFD